MSIKQAIKQVLEEFKVLTNINYYYLKRDSNVNKCVVYTYNEYPKDYADGVEYTTEYDIYLNLILDTNLDKNMKILKNLLKKYGFKKVVINSPYGVELNGIQLFEITMNYKKIIDESEEL